MERATIYRLLQGREGQGQGRYTLLAGVGVGVGGGTGGGVGKQGRASQLWRGAYSRLARISLPDPQLYRPSEHRNLKHVKAGTSVTSFATP